MARKVPMGFEPDIVTIAICDILPLRQVPRSVKTSRKYRQIETAIGKVGIVHPPAVARHPATKGMYLLLDGHIRIEVLKELGIDEVACLVSLDDEAFTYNRQVNRVATIQEHRMILKIVERGVSELEIAEALDVDVASIRAKRNLLRGICPEAVEMLKDKHCPINTIQALRKLKTAAADRGGAADDRDQQLHRVVRQGSGCGDTAGPAGRRPHAQGHERSIP